MSQARVSSKWWQWVLLATALSAAVGMLVVNRTLCRIALVIASAPNAGLTIPNGEDPAPAELAKLGVSRQLRISVGPPHASLSLWIVDPAAKAPRATVLVLHGIRDHKTSMLTAGQELAGAGFRAVLVDSRGHGRSSGDRLGYGALESRDLVQVLDWLGHKGLLAGPVGAYGCSYGGATAIALAGRDERLKAVVTVTTFSSMHEEVVHYARRWGWALWVKLLPDWAIASAIQRAGRLAEFDPNEASPVNAIRHSQARVLLIHGSADDFIPPEHSQRVHAAAPERTELLLLDGEDHGSIFHRRRALIASRSLAWFERWLRADAR